MNSVPERSAIERLAEEAAALRAHADAIDALILELETLYGGQPAGDAPREDDPRVQGREAG